MLTSDYSKILNQINNDMKFITEFYQDILKKSKEFNQDQQFSAILNSEFKEEKAMQAFHTTYHKILVSIIKKLKSEIKPEDKDKSLLLFYFLVSLNPYEEFKEISIDFNRFYEECTNSTFTEIQERISKKQAIEW